MAVVAVSAAHRAVVVVMAVASVAVVVTAVVVVKQGEAVTEEEVIHFCSERLAGFKVPKGIVFVDDLPKNPSGKLLKRELRRRLEAHYAS